MIKILTLFAGLLTGIQTVHLDVAEEVASVEIQLDGQAVAVLEAPPWRTEVDLGEGLRAHRLVALARGAGGSELGRAERSINVREAAYGKLAGDGGEPDVTLTPVAIELDPGVELPPTGELGSWFLGGGRPVEVITVRKGLAEVVMVRHPDTQAALDELARVWVEGSMGRFPIDEPIQALAGDRETFIETVRRAYRQLDPIRETRRAGEIWDAWHSTLSLDAETSLRFLSARAGPVASVSDRKEVFNTTTVHPSTHRYGVLYQVVSIRPLRSPLRVADAVAVAGLEVHGAHKRRAVVVLHSAVNPDESQLAPEQVREYLRDLDVPLLHWSFDQEIPGKVPEVDPLAGWGHVRPVIFPLGTRKPDPLQRLAEAFEELRARLEQQRIVWLAGRFLPGDVRLTERAHGIRLAGEPALEGTMMAELED